MCPPRAVLILIAAALVAGAVPTGVVSAADADDGGLTLSGPGVLDADRDRALVATWQPIAVELPIEADTYPHEVCLRANTSTQSIPLSCQPVFNAAENQTVTVSLSEWPTNLSGRATLVATVVSPNGSVRSRTEQPVFLFVPDRDRDDDGLDNRVEKELGTTLFVADTDRDGLADGPENRTYGTDPTTTDTDGDGLADGVEVNRYGTNPMRVDTDGDGLDDGTEVTTYGTDPTDPDTDGDGLGDATEVTDRRTNPTVADTDDDGLADGPELNVHGTNPLRRDTDGDGLNDGPEVNRYGTDPTVADTDDDGFADGPEVNRYGTDPTRANAAVDGRPDSQSETPGEVSLPASVLPDWVPLPGMTVLAGLLVVVFLTAVLGVLWWGYRHSPSVTHRSQDRERGAGTRTDGPSGESLAHPDAWRIHRLLEEHDGSLPQSEIVDRTDWSKSKVSRVISAMAEADQVRKIRLGRENLVARPGDEPDSARGPFEN